MEHVLRGYDTIWLIQVNKVRIFVHDGGGYPRCLERVVFLWECLVLCQVGCVWLTRESKTRGNSNPCRNSKQRICMYTLMEMSRLLTTMRTMSRSSRWGKRSLGLKDGWVYKDWLLIEFNQSFCWFSRSSFTKFHKIHFISPHFTVINEE